MSEASFFTTDEFLVDAFPFVPGDTYRYEVRVIDFDGGPGGGELPPPPDDANPEDIYYQGYPSGDH